MGGTVAPTWAKVMLWPFKFIEHIFMPDNSNKVHSTTDCLLNAQFTDYE